jgi:predicted N-acetyltransferase YhbS
MIDYRLQRDLMPDEFIDVLVRSTLAERRPVDDRRAIELMLAQADLVLTARDTAAGGMLVGIARALTDFAFCTYLADLAVDVAYQGRGIGRELVRRTHEAAGLDTTLILLAAPNAQTYYPHIGMTKHESCWITPRRAPPAVQQQQQQQQQQ